MSILDSTADGLIELYEWFKKIKFEPFKQKLQISKPKSPFNMSAFADGFRGSEYEAFDIEDKMNAILQTRLEKAISIIFSDEMIVKALIEANVIGTAKECIGKEINRIVKRDASAIVEEALEDLEDNFEITYAVKKFVENKIKDSFTV